MLMVYYCQLSIQLLFGMTLTHCVNLLNSDNKAVLDEKRHFKTFWKYRLFGQQIKNRCETKTLKNKNWIGHIVKFAILSNMTISFKIKQTQNFRKIWKKS